MRPFALALLLLAPAAALADYDAEGRRDPFVAPSVVTHGDAAWDQLRLRAVLTTADGGRALLVGGPAGEGTLVGPGDALGTASVRSLDAARGAILLDVPDARSLRGFRPVTLTLR